jgi:hypothetical protein
MTSDILAEIFLEAEQVAEVIRYLIAVFDAKEYEECGGDVAEGEESLCASANPAGLCVLALQLPRECPFFDITGVLAVFVSLLAVQFGADFGTALLDAVFYLIVEERLILKLVYLHSRKKSYSHLQRIFIFITFAKINKKYISA